MDERLEFYIYEGELWCKNGTENILIDGSQTELLDTILDFVKEHYPDAYNALCERYRDSAPNKPYYKYMMAKRFVRCNFGTLDSTMYDIEAGRMNFERIDCPIRGECKYDGKICSPLFNAHMTLQEQRVAKLWYEGAEKDEIAGVLFISPETVNNHIRNIYHKLNVHDKGEFVRYIDAHSVFGHSSHSR